MKLRVTFSDNAQIMLEFFHWPIFYWPKIQIQSQWQRIWQRTSKQCQLWWESDTFSFRKVSVEGQPCLPHPSQQNSADWIKKTLFFFKVWSITSYQGNASKCYEKALTCLQILIFLWSYHLQICIIFHFRRLLQTICMNHYVWLRKEWNR